MTSFLDSSRLSRRLSGLIRGIEIFFLSTHHFIAQCQSSIAGCKLSHWRDHHWDHHNTSLAVSRCRIMLVHAGQYWAGLT